MSKSLNCFFSLLYCLLQCILLVEAEAYDGKFIDGHVHLASGSDPKLIQALFQEQNVSGAVFFPRYFYAGGEPGISEHQVSSFEPLGQLLVGLQLPILHRDKPNKFWMSPDESWQSWLSNARSELVTGNRKGLGELIIRHYDYHGQGHGEVDFPIDSLVFKSLLELSSDTSRPLVIHAEGEPEVREKILKTLPSYPNARVVWAHGCGRSDPKLIYQWFKSNSNLYCDLANMTDTGHYGSMWPRAGEWTFQLERNGVIEPEWIKVIHAFPERLYLGSDVNETKGWKSAWKKRIIRFRKLLDQVSSPAQEWLAWRTVESLYGTTQAR